MGVPLANGAGIRPSSERVIDMGELSEVISRTKSSSTSARAPSTPVNSLRKSSKPPPAADTAENVYVAVPRTASPREQVVVRIHRLTFGACGFWLSGMGAGLFGAPLGIEVGLNLAAFAFLGWGMLVARSFLNQPQVNVVCKRKT